MDKETLEALEAGYLYALQTPHDRLRLRNQQALILLRDAIAEATGRGIQDVQDDFESRALEERLKHEGY